VAYDVADSKMRRELYRILCGYGEPVQKSVFRCTLDSTIRQRLERELAEFSLGPSDSLLVETLQTQSPMSPCLLVN
jgi:CRISPR-associated endonuclease Cas2